MSDTSRMKAILLVAASVAFVLSPVVSGSFGGFEPGQFPVPQDKPPVQPAGYAFSIWGLIYLGLLAHAGFGLFARADDPAWDAPRWALIASLVAGAAWIPVAKISPLMATELIWFMLLTALIGLARAPREEPWLGQMPVALYAGWLTAASFVSLALVGAGYGIGPGALPWAWIALALALVFAAWCQWRLRPGPGYGFAVSWGLAGIAVANWGAQIGLSVAAAAGALVMLALAVAGARRA